VTDFSVRASWVTFDVAIVHTNWIILGILSASLAWVTIAIVATVAEKANLIATHFTAIPACAAITVILASDFFALVIFGIAELAGGTCVRVVWSTALYTTLVSVIAVFIIFTLVVTHTSRAGTGVFCAGSVSLV
jgi:hypothetical protein